MEPEPSTEKYIEYREMELGKILVPILRGGDFQRDPSMSFVKQIVDQYSPLAENPLKVAFYKAPNDEKERFWLWEGDHNFLALKQMGHRTAMCQIAYGYSAREVSREFALQGKRRRSVGKKDTFRAMLFAEDPTYVAAVHIIEGNGFLLDMSRSGAGSTTHKITAHGAIGKIIENPGGLATLDLALRCIMQALGKPGEPAPKFTSDFLTGLTDFIRRYGRTAPMPAVGRNYFEGRIVAILSDYDEKTIARKGRELTIEKNATLPERITIALVHYYNHGRQPQYRLAMSA